MTRDQLEELLSAEPVIGSHPTDPTAGQKWVNDAAAAIRSLLAQEPVAVVDLSKCDPRLVQLGYSLTHGQELYAAPVPAANVNQWAVGGKSVMPSQQRIPTFDVDEAMRLADEYAEAESAFDAGEAKNGQLNAARAALQAHLDKLGGKND